MPLVNGRKFPPLVMANTIEPKEIVWLWYPYIPAGSASMIFGPGGMGKSHIAVDIASRITTGRGFPGQNHPLPAQNVLMLSAEDEFDRVLVPRLIKSKADLTKVAFPKTPFTLDTDGLVMVENYITGFAAGIVFIDPLVAYIGGKVDINRANETRTFTGGLHQMAMRTGVPIIVIHHARKGNEGADFERMMGSADFSNAVRSVMFVTQAPNGDKIMKHAKSNYAQEGPTQGFAFNDEGFEWTGVYDDAGLAAPRAPKTGDIAGAIKKRLAAGPVRAVEMEQWYADKGYSRRSVIKAKAGVAESYLVSENGKMTWYWRAVEGTNDAGEAEVPIMGKQWGAEKPDRVQREINAHTEERARTTSPKVASRGLSDDDLAAWAKDNL